MIAIAFLELCILCIYYFVVFFFFFVCLFFPDGYTSRFSGKSGFDRVLLPLHTSNKWKHVRFLRQHGGSIDMGIYWHAPKKKMYSPIEHDRWHREWDIGLSVWPKDKTVVCVGVPGCPLSNDNQEEHRPQRSRWTLLFPLRNLDK